MNKQIDTGDTVLHEPSQEIWVIAYADYKTDKLSWLGWPQDGEANISDCKLIEKATPEKQAKALEILRKEPAAKRYLLPASISDLVETDIRGDAFELVAITKAISEWSANQSGFPMGVGVLDMDVGDIVSLSGMAVQRAQRIVELTNEFESKVTSIGVQA